ncbi:hypothetical protein B0H11DRAFT_1966374 [Mycena galericulata]|nr:hypothetical protein B0H11DRAFT_1966374 [Mycena galericulata]
MWDICREAWASALSCLPAEDLTPAQLVLKGQYEAGLKSADAGEAKKNAAMQSGKYISEVSVGARAGNLPWERAFELASQDKLARGEMPSSGFVILNAYRDFIRGMTTMQNVKVTQKGDVMEIKNSSGTSALTDITNGLLRDIRVFHATGQFFEQLEAQMRLEARSAGAWVSGGPKQIQKEVPERLRKTGWLPVRRSLTVTIRIWIMRGFVDGNIGRLTARVEFFKRILDVLDWGRRTFPNVSKEERGAIFEDSFIRGIRRLFIPAVLTLYLKEGPNSGYTLEDIAQMAREMKAETEASARPPDWYLDPGFYASFWIYPIAEALSILGAYHMQLGFKIVDRDFCQSSEGDIFKPDPQAAIDFSRSAEYYQQAAEKYPEDDEQRAYFLAIALEALWWSYAPLRTTLPVCRSIQVAMSKSVQIWEFSQNAERNTKSEEAVQFLAYCEKELATGKATLDSSLMPQDLMERRAATIAQQQDA